MVKLRHFFFMLIIVSLIYCGSAFFASAAVISFALADEIRVCESDIGSITFEGLSNWLKKKNLPRDLLYDYHKSKKMLDLMLEELLIRNEAKQGLTPGSLTAFNELKKSIVEGFRVCVTEQEIQKYYQQHRYFFYRKPQYRLSHILVDDAEKLKIAINSFTTSLSKTDPLYAAMINIANSLTQNDPSSRRWGDLGWVSEGKFLKEFDKNVFSLKNNGEYAAFQSPFGHHFVMVMHIRGPKIYSLEEVRLYIKHKLNIQKKTESWIKYIKESKQKYRVRFYHDDLEKACLDEERKKKMAFIRGEEIYLGYNKKEIKRRYKFWEKHVLPYVDQDEPGWMDYIYQTYHKARLNSFYIDKYEVSYRQYKEFQEATDHRPLPEGIEKFIIDDDYPVVGVNWHDARAYCKYRGKRLPTHDEWELAARGKTRRTYPWGNKSPDGTKGNFADMNSDTPWKNVYFNDGYKYLAPISSYPKGATPEGVYNLGGNAREWTATLGRKEKVALTKGGSFENAFDDMQGADARPYKVDMAHHTLGFRCACNNLEDE